MGLQQNLKAETVDKLNLRTPVTVGTSATVREAVEQMRARRVGCALIVDEDGRAVGEFTEAILRSCLSQSPDVVADVVTDHMATTFPWVTLSDSIETVLAAMETRNTRFIAVLDEERRVVGLTGQKSLMEYVAEHFPREVMVQHVGSTAGAPKREGA